MKKQYFAWKDGKQNTNGTQEWVELTAKEFCELGIKIRTGQTDTKRYFACVPPAEKGDIYFYFECDYEGFVISERERMERFRRAIEEQELKEKNLWFDLVSLDFVLYGDDGDEYTLHDVIADPDSMFEDQLITSMCLQKALSILSREEMQIVNALYLAPKTVSETELSEMLHIPRTTLQSRKYKILKKIKNNFGNF